MGAVVRRPRRAPRPAPARACSRCRHVGQVERVERGLERQQDLDLPRVVVAELGRELVEHLDVGEQLADLGPTSTTARGHQPVDGVGRRGDLVAEGRRAPRRSARAGWRRPRRTARPARPESTGTQSLSGFSAFTWVPSGRWTSPSAWNPASAREPEVDDQLGCARSAGTSPVSRNHVVAHAGPHGSPIANAAYAWALAVAKGTGSPTVPSAAGGTCQASTVRSATCRRSAGGRAGRPAGAGGPGSRCVGRASRHAIEGRFEVSSLALARHPQPPRESVVEVWTAARASKPRCGNVASTRHDGPVPGDAERVRLRRTPRRRGRHHPPRQAGHRAARARAQEFVAEVEGGDAPSR